MSSSWGVLCVSPPLFKVPTAPLPAFLRCTAGPSNTVRWPAPQLLLRYAAAEAGVATSEEHEGKPGQGADGASCQADAVERQAVGSCKAGAVEAEAEVVGTAAEGKRGAGETEASAGSEGPSPQEGRWSVMAVSLPKPPTVVLPAGCTLHAQVVSAITLVVALLCSAAIVTAALL